jgi:hypothetical protein
LNSSDKFRVLEQIFYSSYYFRDIRGPMPQILSFFMSEFNGVFCSEFLPVLFTQTLFSKGKPLLTCCCIMSYMAYPFIYSVKFKSQKLGQSVWKMQAKYFIRNLKKYVNFCSCFNQHECHSLA